MEEEQYSVVYSATDEQTANIIKIALEDEGIPVMVRPHHTSWLDGALVPAEGSWGEILVPTRDAERASTLLEEYSRGGTNSGQ